MKILNLSKGPGVQALRAQSDKIEYAKYMQKLLLNHPNIEMCFDEVKSLIIEDNHVKGVKTKSKSLAKNQLLQIT